MMHMAFTVPGSGSGFFPKSKQRVAKPITAESSYTYMSVWQRTDIEKSLIHMNFTKHYQVSLVNPLL
jgi:hypothetical protein